MAQIDDLANAERRAYHKAWRAANPDKVKLQNKKYWRKRAEQKLFEQQTVNTNIAKNADHNTE